MSEDRRPRQPHEDLEASQARMARFPDMNPGPVACLTPEGTVLMANVAARRLFGGKALEGECLWNLLPEIDERTRNLVLEEAEPVRLEAKVGDVWLNLSLVREPEGEQIFLYGSDITRQKAAEQDVAERARFPELNPGPVARLQRSGIVLRANPAAREVFGRETLVGISWRELCPALATDTWNSIFEPNASVTHEEAIDGRWYSFALRHAPELDQVFVYGSDVTEMKRAERALAELARLPELNPGPVCRLDRSGAVLLANPAALAVFDEDDLTGRSWIELCPGLDEAKWQRIVGSGSLVSIEATIDRRHYVLTYAPGPEGIFVYGSEITQQKQAEAALRQSEKMATLGTLTAGMAHELNNPAAAVQRAAEQLESAFRQLRESEAELRSVTLSDSATGLMEELLSQTLSSRAEEMEIDELERSDIEAAVEDWLDGRGVDDPWETASQLVDVGYDRAALERLAERIEGKEVGLVARWHAQTSKANGLLEEIRHGSSRFVEIVQAMKAYSYLGQGPLQAVDVNEGLKSTLVILRNKLKRGIRVTQELDPALPRIEAYGSELNQAWTNLIDNAVDAMDGTGALHLATRVEGGHVVVEIEDDGPGIPLEIQDRVYDAFFTTKAPGQGTGLGLNTTYNVIVKKHGGSIDLESTPGRTLFRVRLPAAQAPS